MNRAFRIVIVEDSETQAFRLRALLEEQGWKVQVAGTAEAALAALGDPLPDLILVDYNLPGMRGDEFCRRIRMNLNTRGVPLLMMTGSAPEAAEIGSLESGADDYITKFESPDILLLRIRSLLRKTLAQSVILNRQDSVFRSARILIIDDSPTYLAFVSDALRNQGYDVEGVENGPDGLARLEKQWFDCVLVDLVMPGMDGIEVCRRITGLRPSAERAQTVVILTGSEDKGDINRGFEAGADDFVNKSSDLAVLRARIRALLRRRFFQDEDGRIAEQLKARDLETFNARAGRELAEEMLREQYEHNRMILETAKDAFIGMDSEGAVTVWNPQAEATFGWTAAEIMGRSFYNTVIAPARPEGGVDGVQDFLRAALGAQFNRSIELVAMNRDGREVPVEATVWAVSVGGVHSFNAFVRDISERRRAEEATKKEARLAQLLQSVTVAANRSSNIAHTAQTCLRLICSHTGWPVGHVYLWANNALEMAVPASFWHLEEGAGFTAFRDAGDRCQSSLATGLSGAVLASRKARWIVNLADTSLLSERTSAAAEAGLQSAFAFPVLVEQNIIAVLEFFSPRTVPPDQEFLIMMGQIGTQLGQVVKRQRAEEDLQRAKALAESANRAKSEFLTTMSHEMRTPMNAILGMADLLSESSLLEEQRDYVEIFQKAGANLLHLIDDILDLSKVESGHLELESIGFDLRGLLEKTIEMMALRAKDRGLQLVLEVLPGVPLGLVGDSNRLRQIITNLLGNALKFTERGSVTLRVGPEPRDGVGWLRFSVIDTGIGIDANKTEIIFDRFTQADSSTTRKYGGTGLGLAISKGLVDLMGGRIGCTSEIGKGSTFFFTVPFEIRKHMDSPEDTGPLPMAVPAAVLAGPQPAARILIVEDSEFNLLLVKAYLKYSGYQLDFAENGKIGVEKTMSWNPHLVLMDLLMPVMDGLDATRAIRKWEADTKARPRPILALTAHATGEGAGGSLEAGCNEHLTKPIKKATLLEAISRHLRGGISKPVEEPLPKFLQIDSLPPSHIIDLEQLIAQMDGDASLFRRMAALFLADAPRKMEGIREAVATGNAKGLLKLLHTLKGSAANFFAEPTIAALRRLESMARDADFARAPPACEELSTQLEQLNRELTHLVDSDLVLDVVKDGDCLSC